jgi:hypothetical protein
MVEAQIYRYNIYCSEGFPTKRSVYPMGNKFVLVEFTYQSSLTTSGGSWCTNVETKGVVDSLKEVQKFLDVKY